MLLNARCWAGLGILCALIAPAWATDTGQRLADLVDVVSFEHFQSDLLFTHDGDDRSVGGAEHDPARDNIVSTLESFGIDVEVEAFQFGSMTGYNVIGTLTGVVDPEAQYILGAHYDSLGTPGANDDASGVSALLECARVLSGYETELTVKFIAFDMEEMGLIGSTAYVDDHVGEDIRGMIQLEMLCFDSGGITSSVFGRASSMPIKQAVHDAIMEYGDGLGNVIYGRLDASDHYPFEAAGYEACVLSEADPFEDPYYHTPEDSVDTPGYIDVDYASKFVRSMAGVLADLAGVIMPGCDGDANADGAVDPLDGGYVLARMGCVVGGGDAECDAADVNVDQLVDPLDVGFVMARFGPCP